MIEDAKLGFIVGLFVVAVAWVIKTTVHKSFSVTL